MFKYKPEPEYFKGHIGFTLIHPCFLYVFFVFFLTLLHLLDYSDTVRYEIPNKKK